MQRQFTDWGILAVYTHIIYVSNIFWIQASVRLYTYNGEDMRQLE